MKAGCIRGCLTTRQVAIDKKLRKGFVRLAMSLLDFWESIHDGPHNDVKFLLGRVKHANRNGRVDVGLTPQLEPSPRVSWG